MADWFPHNFANGGLARCVLLAAKADIPTRFDTTKTRSRHGMRGARRLHADLLLAASTLLRERARQILEILKEIWHVGRYRNIPTKGYGVGKIFYCGFQAGLPVGSECSAGNISCTIASDLFQPPAECVQPVEKPLRRHDGRPQRLSEITVLPRPGPNLVGR